MPAATTTSSAVGSGITMGVPPFRISKVYQSLPSVDGSVLIPRSDKRSVAHLHARPRVADRRYGTQNGLQIESRQGWTRLDHDVISRACAQADLLCPRQDLPATRNLTDRVAVQRPENRCAGGGQRGEEHACGQTDGAQQDHHAAVSTSHLQFFSIRPRPGISRTVAMSGNGMKSG
jgi:hypothetical protein